MRFRGDETLAPFRLRKAWLALLAVPVLSLGCAGFLRLSDPTAQSISCAITGALLPELEAIATATGIPLSVVQTLFTSACNESAQHAATQEQATKDALITVRSMAVKLRRMGAVFTNADGGAP